MPSIFNPFTPPATPEEWAETLPLTVGFLERFHSYPTFRPNYRLPMRRTGSFHFGIPNAKDVDWFLCFEDLPSEVQQELSDQLHRPPDSYPDTFLNVKVGMNDYIILPNRETFDQWEFATRLMLGVVQSGLFPDKVQDKYWRVQLFEKFKKEYTNLLHEN